LKIYMDWLSSSNRKVSKPLVHLSLWHRVAASLRPSCLYPLWWYSLTKDKQVEPFCVGVVW